eukprot:2453292-Amphidinium_carterae.1
MKGNDKLTSHSRHTTPRNHGSNTLAHYYNILKTSTAFLFQLSHNIQEHEQATLAWKGLTHLQVGLNKAEPVGWHL